MHLKHLDISWRPRLRRWFARGVQIHHEVGTWATVKWFWKSVVWHMKRINPEFNRRYMEHISFDERYGVDTEGTVLLEAFDLSKQQKSTGFRYEPTYPWLPRAYLEKIDVSFPDYEYIDLGSGKGRVLLLAAAYPFKRVLGVEFSHELHRVAQRNLVEARIPDRRCSSLEAVCEDASKFVFPISPLIISLFNPFRGVVLQSVLDNLLGSLTQNPRPTYVVYVNPLYRKKIEASGSFAIIAETKKYVIYRYLL